MRATKTAIALALAADEAVAALVPPTQIYEVERATVSVLPSIEMIGVTSERVGDGPMASHAMNVEVTVSHATKDGADELLDSIVRAVRARLSASEDSTRPIALATGEAVLCVFAGTRWSVSAANASGVIRGASVSVSAEVAE